MLRSDFALLTLPPLSSSEAFGFCSGPCFPTFLPSYFFSFRLDEWDLQSLRRSGLCSRPHFVTVLPSWFFSFRSLPNSACTFCCDYLLVRISRSRFSWYEQIWRLSGQLRVQDSPFTETSSARSFHAALRAVPTAGNR